MDEIMVTITNTITSVGVTTTMYILDGTIDGTPVRTIVVSQIMMGDLLLFAMVALIFVYLLVRVFRSWLR